MREADHLKIPQRQAQARLRVQICSRFPFQSYWQGHVANCYLPMCYHSKSVLFSSRNDEGNLGCRTCSKGCIYTDQN